MGLNCLIALDDLEGLGRRSNAFRYMRKLSELLNQSKMSEFIATSITLSFQVGASAYSQTRYLIETYKHQLHVPRPRIIGTPPRDVRHHSLLF